MSTKPTVAIICGGKSAEHEVSLISAKNVLQAIDKDSYNVVVIGIDKHDSWFFFSNSDFLEEDKGVGSVRLKKTGQPITVVPGVSVTKFITIKKNKPIHVDIIFPLIHGTHGEDGTLQGLLELVNLPYVGPSVIGSALGMDKEVMKRLCKEAGIPVAKWMTVYLYEKRPLFTQVKKQLGLPIFVKPANLGSSVGITKVHTEKEFKKALDTAFAYDTKILIEEGVKGREIECSVLGNETPKASLPGEVRPAGAHEFYDYDAKYLDDKGAELLFPAKLSKQVVTKIQQLAIKTFTTLCCEGMSRVDFFVTKNNKVILNEINTIPGFTSISMYPKLWEVSGIPYQDLISKLLELAVERFKKRQLIKSSITYSEMRQHTLKKRVNASITNILRQYHQSMLSSFNGDYFISPKIPYISQFIGLYPATILTTDKLTNKEHIKKFGAKDSEEFSLWAFRDCAIACVKMILESEGKAKNKTLMNLTNEGIELGGYKLYENNIFVDKGWFHESLVHLIKAYGLSATTKKWQSLESVAKDILQNKKVILSMLLPGRMFIKDDGSFEPKDKNTSYTGHLLLAVGVRMNGTHVEGIYVHDPRGLSTYQKNTYIPAQIFEKNFTNRTIVVN